MEWWQSLIAPIAALLGVVVTMVFNSKSQGARLRAESEEAAAIRSEAAERDDRRRFMVERRDSYVEFAEAVDQWMVEAQTAIYIAEDDEASQSDRDDAEQRRLACSMRIRELLNRMTVISPLHVLGKAADVNTATRDDCRDPIADVQPPLLKFLFECRRDLIGEAFWPRDFEGHGEEDTNELMNALAKRP